MAISSDRPMTGSPALLETPHEQLVLGGADLMLGNGGLSGGEEFLFFFGGVGGWGIGMDLYMIYIAFLLMFFVCFFWAGEWKVIDF